MDSTKVIQYKVCFFVKINKLISFFLALPLKGPKISSVLLFLHILIKWKMRMKKILSSIFSSYSFFLIKWFIRNIHWSNRINTWSFYYFVSCWLINLTQQSIEYKFVEKRWRFEKIDHIYYFIESIFSKRKISFFCWKIFYEQLNSNTTHFQGRYENAK